MRSTILIILFINALSINSCQSGKNNQERASPDIEYRTISGLVVDQNGLPLPKAVVFSRIPELEKPLGTITDEEGRFTFRIPINAKSFSVGYSNKSEIEVQLTKAEQYNITITEDTSLNLKVESEKRED